MSVCLSVCLSVKIASKKIRSGTRGGGGKVENSNSFLPCPFSLFWLTPFSSSLPNSPHFFSHLRRSLLLSPQQTLERPSEELGGKIRKLTFCHFVKNCQHISFPHSNGTILACSTRHAMTPVVESHV